MIYSLRRGSTTPTATDLSIYELGWETTNKRLYIKDNNTIRRIDVKVTLNGVVNSDPSFYAPTALTANRVVKTKASWTNGDDPFEFLSVETNQSTEDSGDLITSGAVYSDLLNLQSTINSALNTKVDKAGDTMTGTLTLPAMILGGKDITWNEVDGTFNMQLNDGVVLQNGQELYFYGKASIAITNGQGVQFVGVEGDHILMRPASGDLVRSNPDIFIGIATHDISVGEFGYVTAVGYVRDIDTVTPGWVAGDKLYVNTYLCAVAGTLTNDKPPAELTTIQVAAVVKEATSAPASNGILLVRVNQISRAISEVSGLDARVKAWDNITSAARLFGGTITSNGDGTVAIAAGGGLSKSQHVDVNGGVCNIECAPTAINAGQGSPTNYVSWEAVSSLALTDNAYNFIYYDRATNSIKATTDFYSVSLTQDFTLGRAYRSGNTVTIRLCGTNAWNFNRRVQLFGEEVFPIVAKKGSLILGYSGRTINHNGGVLWAELVNRFAVDAFNSNTGGTFTYWYRNGVGGFTTVSGQTLINNINYDDGDGTLGTLTPQRYGVHWIYVVHDGTVHVVYGRGDYTLSQAQASTVPTPIPGLLEAYATLIGRVIIQQASTTIFEAASTFETTFNVSGTTIHNELSGRSEADAHPISAITNLNTELANIEGKVFISDTDPGTPPREDSLWFHF